MVRVLVRVRIEGCVNKVFSDFLLSFLIKGRFVCPF